MEETTPPVPDGWTRCHVYLANKKRFCRQLPVYYAKPRAQDGDTTTSQAPCYCGNHQHLIPDEDDDLLRPPKERSEKRGLKRKRIPCPVDPTHFIFEDMAEQHSAICPKTKKEQKQKSESYYQYRINVGGMGVMDDQLKKETTLAEPIPKDSVYELSRAQQIAVRVLQVHQQIFTQAKLSPDEVCRISSKEIEEAIHLEDLSQSELESLSDAIHRYRIKSGGLKHLHQQASLLGHIRRITCDTQSKPGGQGSDRKIENGKSTTELTTEKIAPSFPNDPRRPLKILEVGAGRGMFGLLVGGTMVSSGQPTELIMIERAGTRGKADTVLRSIRKEKTDEASRDKDQIEQSNYMDLQLLDWKRIQCDLAHVDMTAVLDKRSVSLSTGVEESNRERVFVVAKHLCGAGTDLALKSLEPIRDRVDACLLATCCHGVCSWEDYVGRDFLRQIMQQDLAAPMSFNCAEFECLRRWAAGTVVEAAEHESADNGRSQQDKQCSTADIDCLLSDGEFDQSISIVRVVESLGLDCGPQGLGRACQRLIDYGRQQYMKELLFRSCSSCELVYYVPAHITPQNAALIAYRKRNKD